MKVVMPQIGMTMQEATIVNWMKKDGERIEKGEPMMEIETEKMSNVVEAPASGVLKITAQIDDIVPCGEEVAEIVE